MCDWVHLSCVYVVSTVSSIPEIRPLSNHFSPLPPPPPLSPACINCRSFQTLLTSCSRVPQHPLESQGEHITTWPEKTQCLLIALRKKSKLLIIFARTYTTWPVSQEQQLVALYKDFYFSDPMSFHYPTCLVFRGISFPSLNLPSSFLL